MPDIKPSIGALTQRVHRAIGPVAPPIPVREGRSRVAIGLADFGFDPAHVSLRAADGASRFLAIVDQRAAAARRDGTALGLELARRGTAAPAGAGSPHAAHGTMMASIAAGQPVGGHHGVAPEADLIGVSLKLDEPDWKEVDGRGLPTWETWNPSDAPNWDGWKSYGAAPALVAALETLAEEAQRAHADALVINLSLGAHGGARDGRSSVERAIARLREQSRAGEGPAVAVVLAAGNAGAADGHYGTLLKRGGRFSLAWRMDRAGWAPHKLEVWFNADGPDAPAPAVELRAPNRAATWTLAPGPTADLRLQGRRIGIAETLLNASGPLGVVRILIDPRKLPARLGGTGTELEFTLDFSDEAGAGPYEVHAVLEREDVFPPSQRLSPATAESTLSSLAGADGAIIVAAGVLGAAEGAALTPLPASGAGPRPWVTGIAALAPHVVAPGHHIACARAGTRGFTFTTGSSPATALVSGALARLIGAELARAEDSGASPGRIRDRIEAMIDAAGAPRGRPWHPRLGFGPLDSTLWPTRLEVAA